MRDGKRCSPGIARQMIQDPLRGEFGARHETHGRSETGDRCRSDKIEAGHGRFEVRRQAGTVSDQLEPFDNKLLKISVIYQ